MLRLWKFEMTKLVNAPIDAAQYIAQIDDVIDFLNDAFQSGHRPSPQPNQRFIQRLQKP